MEIQRALSQISEIHEHLAKTDVYRGYKAVPVGLSGVIALLAAAFQHHFVNNAETFLAYWLAVALIAAGTAGGGIVYSYFLQESPLARRSTRVAVGQLLPCIVAGVAVTALAPRPEAVQYLPGIWAILFSLGVFASRPYLPRITGWVALYYLVAGSALFAVADGGRSLSPWGMGITFGFGQILAGIVLYWDLERESVH
jgi:hypothetical protein